MHIACRAGDLRLQGSTVQGSGRVEVCINDVWGTVCDNSWSSNDARVTCKQLGFSILGTKNSCTSLYKVLSLILSMQLKGARPYSIYPFVQGNGPIHVDNVRCAGTELSLIDCPHSRSHSCSHRDDAAVQCQGQTAIICTDMHAIQVYIIILQGSFAMMVMLGL